MVPHPQRTAKTPWGTYDHILCLLATKSYRNILNRLLIGSRCWWWWVWKKKRKKMNFHGVTIFSNKSLQFSCNKRTLFCSESPWVPQSCLYIVSFVSESWSSSEIKTWQELDGCEKKSDNLLLFLNKLAFPSQFAAWQLDVSMRLYLTPV